MFRIISFIGLLAICTCDMTFNIMNNVPGTIWVGVQPNSGQPVLNNGGFSLDQGGQMTVMSPDNWAGRFWARTYCDPNSNTCVTGDCGAQLECNGAGGNPPVTLAEITLQGDGGNDFYDISLVDGYNVGVTMSPQGGNGDGSAKSCGTASCTADINSVCPGPLQVTADGNVAGCKSACAATNEDQYCCRGDYGQPDTCNPDTWPQDENSAQLFKSQCPDAYSYAYDDQTSTYTCSGAAAYDITFG